MNKYFTTVFLREADSSDNNSISVAAISDETMSHIVLEQNEFFSSLRYLDPSKAFGPDNIPVRLIKECAQSITPSLT